MSASIMMIASFSSFGFAIKIFQFFSATTKEVLRQKLISGYVEGGYVEGERIEGYVKDACVEGCVEGRCVKDALKTVCSVLYYFLEVFYLVCGGLQQVLEELLLKGSNFFDSTHLDGKDQSQLYNLDQLW
ncbi:unnamed protein product [Rhizophagus irregularis]|nr:unnamed protein product [Rhizophagus irregularis]